MSYSYLPRLRKNTISDRHNLRSLMIGHRRELKKLINLVDLAGQLACSALAHGMTPLAQLSSSKQRLEQELQDSIWKAQFRPFFSKGKFSREGNEMVEFYISTQPW